MYIHFIQIMLYATRYENDMLLTFYKIHIFPTGHAQSLQFIYE